MSNHSLDFPTEEFKRLLNKSSELVISKFKNLESRPAFQATVQSEVAAWFDEPLPELGMDIFELLSFTDEKILQTATDNLGEHMYGYVMAGGNQISILAETLAATINQNVGKWHLSPAISEIEKLVIRWAAQMMNYATEVGGVLVSGGSAANLHGLTIARNIFFEKHNIRKKGLFGMQPFTVYASKEVHGCIDKSLEFLGIGSDQIRKIETHSDFTLNLEALENQIDLDRSAGYLPFCIVGNAGTVNTGAIDDLEGLANIAKTHNCWFHVDGAYGGLAASLESIKDEYKGLEKADSLAVDFHKWLYQPFEAGCVLVKDWETLKRTYYKRADYLDTELESKGRLDFNEHTFQLSRSAKSLKIWMSLKAYGAKNFRNMIQKDIDLTHYLADQIKQSPDFELKSRSHLAIACFRYKGNHTDAVAIENLNKQLIPALEKDGRVFITGTRLNGEFVLRACVINHRKTKRSIDYLIGVIRETATSLNL